MRYIKFILKGVVGMSIVGAAMFLSVNVAKADEPVQGGVIGVPLTTTVSMLILVTGYIYAMKEPRHLVSKFVNVFNG